MKFCDYKGSVQITYYFKKVKVCKEHKHFDGLHEHNDGQGRYPCRCSKGKA